MFHNEPDRGRRPLLSTFDGNNRQMLQEIRDSLSHHLRNNDGDAESVSHLQHVRPELSQSTPNLLEKISGASTKNMTRMGYNKKAMAEIRNSLRPFQTNNESPNSSGTGQQMNGDTYADPHVNRHFLQQLIAMGFDEDLSCKVLKLSGNKSVEAARELIVRLSEEPKNGYPKGLGYTKVHRKPSFEMKYGQNSPDSSVRSESPGMNVHARGPYMQCNSSSNGHQTPPPLPPRAPIVPSVNRGQTPPYSNDQTLVSNSQQVSPGQNQQSCIPPGHVQQLIKKMSPSSTQIVRPQVVQSDPISEQNVQPLIQNGSPQHNSNNQQQIGQQTVIVQNNQNPQRPNYVLTPQFQHLTISHSNHNNNINNLSTNTNGNSADVTIKYTPTYNPQHMHPTPVSLQRTVNDQTHMISQVPEYTKYESHLTVNKNSHVTTSGSDCVQISLPRRTEPSPPLAAPAAMQAWTQQPPIIMKSVKSQKVSKPVLQTATAPVSFQPPSGSPQNFISSVQAQVNSSQKQAHQHNNNFEIEITRQRQNHHNNLQSQLQQMQAHSKGQQTIKVKIHPYPHNQTNFQIQNFPNSRDYYARSSSETPTSTPRSDSPVSRAMNHSPLSMLSTTSSPSTNSDIPDKPPPPYPGRTVNYPTHYNQGQPPIPPRVPIHPQNKPPPPPPPQYTITSNVPVQTILPNQMHRLPPPPLPSVIESDQQSQQSSNSVTSSNCQDGPGDETDNDVQSETHSETHSDGSREKHCCTSPIPERKPENKEMDSFRYDTKVRNYSPQAFKFFMEQHVENLLKSHQQRQKRRLQLEKEMSKAQLSEEAQSQMRRMLHQKESNYNRLKRAKMDKSMFTKIETLGVGAFGEVALVRKKDGGQLYAMKTLQKNDVLKRNQVAHVKAERDILAEADHEWVVKLYYSFQDKDNLYFVMDYIPGGDLMGLLIKFGIFEEPLSRFYIAELVLAIESVHKMGFIHRDIKPDNILIDKDGHIKLTDFGLCTGFRWTHNSKLYQVNQKDGNHLRQDSMELGCLKEECNCDIHKPLERRRQRDKQRCVAQSLVGTPNYIAPEVLLRQGYTACCDWWSVGVILYEMLVGSPPFYADSPLETQKKVIGWKETLQIPEGADLSQPAKDLILRLCCDSEYRLGRNGASEIKDHSFFHPIEFTNLRKQSAPFIPVISHATDTRYFDPVDPDKLRKSDSDSENLKKYEVPGENGKHPQHAFFEFTFRRFFDDGGHPYPKIKDPDAPVGNRTK